MQKENKKCDLYDKDGKLFISKCAEYCLQGAIMSRHVARSAEVRIFGENIVINHIDRKDNISDINVYSNLIAVNRLLTVVDSYLSGSMPTGKHFNIMLNNMQILTSKTRGTQSILLKTEYDHVYLDYFEAKNFHACLRHVVRYIAA